MHKITLLSFAAALTVCGTLYAAAEPGNHDFGSNILPPGGEFNGKIVAGTFHSGDSYVMGYIPVTIKGAPLMLRLNAAHAADAPANLAVLLIERKNGIDSVVKHLKLPLELTARNVDYLIPVEAADGQYRIALYRIEAKTNKFGTGGTVLLKNFAVRTSSAAEIEKIRKPRPAVADNVQNCPVTLDLGAAKPGQGIFFKGRPDTADGKKVRVFATPQDYDCLTIHVNLLSGLPLELKMRVKAAGNPPAQLGVILYTWDDNGKLVTVTNAAWLKPVAGGDFDDFACRINGALLKKSGKYCLIVYRANQKGELFIDTVSLTQHKEKVMLLRYKETPDLVSPLKTGASGTADFQLSISGADSGKMIKELWVRADTGAAWTSGDGVKKNYWLAAYAPSAAYATGKFQLYDNLDGKQTPAFNNMEIFFESSGSAPVGVRFECRITYADNSVQTWSGIPVAAAKRRSGYNFTHRQNTLLPEANNVCPPALWAPAATGKHSYRHNLEQPGKPGSRFYRLMSPSYFFPLTDRVPSAAGLRNLVPQSSRLAIREMEIYDHNRVNIAPQTKISVTCNGRQIPDSAALTDGISAPGKGCLATPEVLDKPIDATVLFDFGKVREIGGISLRHGMPNGSQTAWTLRDFSVEISPDNRNWHPLPGAAFQANTKAENSVTFPVRPCRALRLRVNGVNSLYAYNRYPFDLKNPLLNISRTEKLSPDTPFTWWYIGHDGPTHFSWPENPEPDMAAYGEWKKRHPNFLGFQVAEFDNDLRHFLQWDSRDTSPRRIYDERGKVCVIEQQLPPPPRTRAEAIAQFEKTFKRYKSMLFNDISMFCSLSIWTHYGMEWGANSAVLENGGGGAPTFGMQIAATRGAARQYGGKAWGIYYATFVSYGYLNYLDSGKGQYYKYGPDCGKSASLYRRQLFAGYLGGANFADFEHPEFALHRTAAKNGKPAELSPHGMAAQEVMNFALAHPERGRIFTPLAVLLDWEHGWSHRDSAKIFFGALPTTRGDLMTDAVMHTLFGIENNAREGYGHFMSSTGRSGLTDILVANPPSGAITPQTLSPYRAVILSGDIRWSASLQKNLRDFVTSGGTLIVNSEQLPPDFPTDFTGLKLGKEYTFASHTFTAAGEKINREPEKYQVRHAEALTAQMLLRTEKGLPLLWRNKLGRGSVITGTQSYFIEEPQKLKAKQGVAALNYLTSLLAYEALPFSVTGNGTPEITISVLPGNVWQLAVLNNQGVYKLGTEKESVKKDETFTGRLEAKSPLSGVEILLPKARQLPLSGNGVAISVPPGEVQIYRLKFPPK